MKILITGGTGLVGSAFKNIQNKYSYEFYFLSSKECDLSDYKQTFRLIHLKFLSAGSYKLEN